MKRTAMLIIAASLTAAVLFPGCMTTTYRAGDSKSEVKKNILNGSWEKPENSVIIFGSEYTSFEVLQQNPKFGYKLYEAQMQGKSNSNTIGFLTLIKSTSMFFVQPLPVGSELKVYSYTDMEGMQSVCNYCGIGGVDIKLTKPGLVYYDKNDTGHKNELASLKVMQSYFTGTDWETVIVNRIQEIENEKK
jgi:hypothetical protein